MIDHVKQKLDAMHAQEKGLLAELDRVTEQLTMTRGAIQGFQHVLDTYEEGEEQSPSEERANTLAKR